jgi:Peptidase A4 family
MLRIVRSAAIGASMVLASGVVTFSGAAITPLASPSATVHVQSVDQRAKAAEAKAALLRYLKNGRPTVKLIRRSGLQPSRTNLRAAASAGSYNWSGYASYSSTQQAFSAVYGSWVVPKLFCSSEQRLASDWVGLDGYTDSTVEQDGTLGWCFQGTAYYYTWWEMYPASSTTVGTSVNPGDKISAKVTRSGTSYTLAVTDATTTGNSFSVTQSCAASTCLDESAEWIHERPSFSIGVAPLASSFSWGLYGGSEVSGGTTGTIAGAPNVTALTMIDATSTYNLATPTALATSGKGFTVQYQNSY